MKLSSRDIVFTALCGIILFLSIGQRHSFGLYLIPVTTDWSWRRETFSIAIALQNLVWGVAQPFAGMLADKIGSKRVMALGGAFYATGVFLMPYSNDGLLFAVTAGVFVGIGLSGTAFAIVYGAVGKAVSPERRPTALGLVGAIGGAGQLLMLPVNMTLIESFGWKTSALFISAAISAMIPLAFATGKSELTPPTSSDLTLRQTLAKAFGDRDFWLLTVGFLACGFQLAFIATHMPAYLADNGLRPSVATTALGLIALTNIVGTYLFGVWGTRWLRKTLTVWLYIGRAAAILMLLWLPLSPLTVYAFAAVMGFLWLGTVPLTNGMIGQIYGMRYVSTLFGFVFLSHQVGSFLGVWLGGWLFDTYKSYTWVWILASVLSLLSAILHAPIRERRSSVAPSAAS